MRIGIIGLPQSGKTTLFQALTDTSPDLTASYGKTEAHIATVKVPDPRLDRIHDFYPKAKKTPATIEYADVAGLSKGSSQRKGFADQFLGNLRTVDAIFSVLRNFENDAVAHPEGDIDPKRDLEIIESEILLSDMSVLENRIAKVSADVKKVKSEELQHELELLERCLSALETEQPLRELEFSEFDEKLMRGFQFLTAKPMLIILNIGEESLGREESLCRDFESFAGGKQKVIDCICAELEAEIIQLPEDERAAYQEEMGITEPALNKVIRSSYQLLGLIPFFTVGDKEVRAWTVKSGTRAQSAAGEVHTDMERGFIRAEVVDFETLDELGSLGKCRELGVLRLEGKDYDVKDGDVITFRFNV